ncbi:MAG: dnaA [Candidatus Midichloriaceae bacterium]|nr:dnaA [Candidatus Midichloriaceae bacterium]
MKDTSSLLLHNSQISIWNDVALALRKEVGELNYRNWLGHLTFKSIAENTLILSAPTKFIREWIETHYLHIISKVCANFGLIAESIQIEVNAVSVPAANSNRQIESEARDVQSQCDIFDFNLDPRFVFDAFMVGQSNKVAYSAAKAVAENKLPTNILYIHGAVGQGKTHLLQAIAAQVQSSGTARKLAYLSAEKFMHLFLKYLRANDLIGFKEKIKSCDIFLVDDLQFICGKAATQQEFSNLLSALTEANKMVVISSDSTPFALQLDARSKSRLIGGLVVEITQSDYDLRLAILQSKVSRAGVDVDTQVLELIAKNIVASNRELEGAINKLIAYASFEQTEITTADAANLLKSNLDAGQVTIDLEKIVNVVSAYFSIDSADILSKSRSAKFTIPRQICALLAKNLTTKSLVDIGIGLGKRDHASVIYYIKQIEQKRKSDPNLDKQIQEIEALLQEYTKPL